MGAKASRHACEKIEPPRSRGRCPRARGEARRRVAGGSAAFTGGAGEDPRVSVFLDTNVLIRHLTGDPPVQARRATAFLVAADELLVPDLVVAEVVFALESFYEVKRERVAELSGR